MTLPDFLQKALGVPFKPKGRDYTGWDCFAVLYCAYRDVLGIQMPSYVDDYVDPGDTDASRRVIQDMILAAKHQWAPVSRPRAMDVVLFTYGATRTHLGLMVDAKQFLHCERNIGTVIERVDSAKWRSRVEGIYRLKIPQEQSCVCDICKEKPEPFECGPVAGPADAKGFYTIVPADSHDPTTLMSNGECVFKIWPHVSHPVLKAKTGELFICSSCFYKRFPCEDAESGEEWKHGK